MATDTMTISGSFSPDGNFTVLESFTPNSGECWYVDSMTVASDGSGGGTEVVWLYAGILSSDITLVDDFMWQKNGSKISDAAKVTENAVMDWYIDDSVDLLVVEHSFSTSATIHYTITLRRVI